MVFMKSIYNMLGKFLRDIFNNVYRSFLRVIGYIVVLLVISLAARSCAKAMTINDNLRTIGDTQFRILENIYERSNYDNYLIASDYVNNGYNNYMNYYVCLTNDKIDTSNVKNVNSNCEELYRYYSYSSNYTLEKVNDSQLKIVNSMYYTNTLLSKPYYYNVFILLIIIVLFLIIFWLFYVFGKVFRL